MRAAEAGPAADRIVRRFGLMIGLVGTIAGLFELPEILVQQRSLPLFWTVISVAVGFGMLPVLAVVSLVAGPRLIRAVAGAAALGYLATMGLVLFCYEQLSVEAGVIWVYRLVVVGVLAAALAWQPWPAGIYLVVMCVIPGAGMYFLSDIAPAAAATTSGRSAGLSVLVLWCVSYARSASARVDRESLIESERAADVAGTAARERERARFAALIHDAVLSTLLDASRRDTTSQMIRTQAARTLDQLDAIRKTGTGVDSLDMNSVGGFLRSTVHELDEGIEFRALRDGYAGDVRLPVETAGTLAAALTEAVRNSVRHAAAGSRPVRRTVTVTVGAGGLRVVMRDDGAGFDRSAVPADRLGIAVSIVGRMRQLPGGAAFVESAPGQGTTVTLVWGSSGEGWQ